MLAGQLEAVENASRIRGQDGLSLALLTDGLRAERKRGITIDMAYRYFATLRRFILADTPGGRRSSRAPETVGRHDVRVVERFAESSTGCLPVGA